MVSDVLVDLENAPNRHHDNQKTSLDVSKYRVENVEEEEEEEEEGECEDASSVSSAGLDCDNSGAVVLQDARHDRSPCFQNIEVSNSSDVHFGNKTIYQGPVTIKQILYTNPNNSEEQSASGGVGEGTLPIANGTQNNNNGFAGDYVADRGAAKDGTAASATNNSNWTGKSKGKKWLQSRTSKQLIIGTIVLMLIVVCIVAVTIILLTTYLPENTNGSIQHITVGEEPDINEPDNDPEAVVNILYRRSWVAEPASQTAPLKQPVPKVVIVETSTDHCAVQYDCIFIVRHLQTNHKEGFSLWDIRYNFLVGGDGNVYEGRGWSNVGATVPNCNDNIIGIAFIGAFSHTSPTEKQAKAGRRLIAFGVKNGHISRNYELVYASQLIDQGLNNVNSGEKLDEIVESWPHWSNVTYRTNDTLKQKFCNS